MPKKRIARAVAAVILVGVSLFLANTVGLDGAGETGGYWCFGWPAMYHMRSCTWENWDGSDVSNSRWFFGSDVPGGEYYSALATMPALEFTEPSVALANVHLALLILACTCYVMLSAEFDGFPRQWTLRQFLALITLVAVLLSLTHYGPLSWWPAMTWKPAVVFFPILFGLLCVAMAVESLLARAAAFTVRSLKAQRDGDHERS